MPGDRPVADPAIKPPTTITGMISNGLIAPAGGAPIGGAAGITMGGTGGAV